MGLGGQHVTGVPTESLAGSPTARVGGRLSLWASHLGELGAPREWSCLLWGRPPQPEDCGKGAIATQMGLLNPGRTLTSKGGTEAQGGTGHRRSIWPSVLPQGCLPVSGLRPVGAERPWAGLVRGGLRPEGLPGWTQREMGRAKLGQRRMDAEGSKPEALGCGSGCDPSPPWSSHL